MGTVQAEVGSRDGGARRVKRMEAGEEGDGKGEEGWGWAGSIVGRVLRNRAGEGSGEIGKTGNGVLPGNLGSRVITGYLLCVLG